MNFVYLAQEIYHGLDETNTHVENTIVFSSLDKIRANYYIIDGIAMMELRKFGKTICRHKSDDLVGYYELEITKVRII